MHLLQLQSSLLLFFISFLVSAWIQIKKFDRKDEVQRNNMVSCLLVRELESRILEAVSREVLIMYPLPWNLVLFSLKIFLLKNGDLI